MRKTNQITFSEGRDKGKTFLLTEMGAVQAEKWAARALLAVAKSGVDLPENLAGAGMAGLAVLTFKALSGVTFAEVEPLLDEMMACVQIVEPAMTRSVTLDDIEEVSTILRLRAEVFTLHTGFSLPGSRSGPGAGTAPPTISNA